MRHHSKRWLTTVLLLSVFLGLVACGGGGGGGETQLPGSSNPPANQPPAIQPPGSTLAAENDTYAWLGNSRINVPAANGVLANDTLATGIATFQNPSTQGGSVAIAPDGSFTYEPPAPTVAGAFSGTDTFTYTASAADGSTAQGTVTMNIAQVAWYVKNDFVGTGVGTSTAPFTTLAAASAASGPGQTIFVFTGDGTMLGQNSGIDLFPNQRLLGQGVGLTFDVLPTDPNNDLLPVSGVATTTTTANPAARPVIGDSVNIIDNLPIIGLASGVEVAGVTVDGAGTLANMNGLSGLNIDGFNIHHNAIRNLPRAGIQLGGASSGTGTIMNNTLTDLIGPNPDNAIDLVTTATNVVFTISGNTLNNVSETGLRVQYGAGTVQVTDNQLTNVGTADGRRGIDVEGAGTASITGNSVDNSAGNPVARSGIQVNANGTLAARINNNSVTNADSADGGIQAQTTLVTSDLCLQMRDNTSDTVMVLDNRTTGNTPANFSIEGPLQAGFEGANTGTFSYQQNVNAVAFVAVGTCGFAP